jgi:hypothetical protein
MRFRARCWLAAISLGLVACARTPDSYPVAEQHAPFRAGGLDSLDFVTFDRADLSRWIVKDVLGDEKGPWRWTGADPELRFTLTSTQNRTLIVEFAINNRTFAETGPVGVSFFVNDHLAGAERYTSFGDKSFERAIPAAWLDGRPETRVRLHIDKVWSGPGGGPQLGILLRRAGFAE